MSTVTAPQSTVTELEHQLNQQILQGDILGAFDRFYADDVVMQENSQEPTNGKAANRKREEAFLAAIEQFHGAEMHVSAVNGNVSFSEWTVDATYKGGGRFALTQVAVRRWKDGKVVHERFYYSKG
jgi:ketosteroid isomerase-like protein